MNEAQIFPVRRVRGKLTRQRLVRGVVLCNDQKSARQPIDAVHDARPDLPACAGQRPEAVQKRVDERSGRIPGRRMNDHALRFIDDGKVVVLVNHVKRNVLRLQQSVLVRFGNEDADRIARTNRAVRPARLPVQRNGAFFDQLLEL